MLQKSCVGMFVPIVILALAIVLTGRDRSEHLAPKPLPESHFFADSECVIACWQGLRPGKTTRSEVTEFLKRLSASDPDIGQHGEYTSYIVSDKQQILISAVVKRDLLFRLQLSGATNLSIVRVIEVLGDPPIILPYYLTTPIGSVDGYLDLYYPEQGYIFHAQGEGINAQRRTDEKVDVCIQREAKVSLVNIVIPGTISTILSEDSIPFNQISEQGIEERIKSTISWPGFVCVTPLIPSR